MIQLPGCRGCLLSVRSIPAPDTLRYTVRRPCGQAQAGHPSDVVPAVTDGRHHAVAAHTGRKNSEVRGSASIPNSARGANRRPPRPPGLPPAGVFREAPERRTRAYRLPTDSNTRRQPPLEPFPPGPRGKETDDLRCPDPTTGP